MPIKQPDPSRERVLEALAAIDCEEPIRHDPGPSYPADDEPALQIAEHIAEIHKQARKITDILRREVELDIRSFAAFTADERYEKKALWLQEVLTEVIADAATKAMAVRIYKAMEARHG